VDRDYAKELERDDQRSQAFRQWLNARREHIHAHVTAADILSLNGVILRRSGAQEEQISCPFHGADNKPSARYHPESSRGPSGVWCFVCHERWDCIKLLQKFSGCRYMEALFQIEKNFSLTPPEPGDIGGIEDPYDPLQEEVDQLFEVCETRLRENREKFDLTAHLKLGSMLDHTRYRLDHGAVPLVEAQKRLTQILGKIGEKIRAKTPTAT
jgi:DNA primase